MAKHKTTREEKFVTLLIDLMSDLRLDLDLVGFYFVQVARKIDVLRLGNIVDSINEHRNEQIERDRHYEKVYRGDF